MAAFEWDICKEGGELWGVCVCVCFCFFGGGGCLGEYGWSFLFDKIRLKECFSSAQGAVVREFVLLHLGTRMSNYLDVNRGRLHRRLVFVRFSFSGESLPLPV